MKNKLTLFLIFILFSNFLLAQKTQKGLVREFNSNKKTLSGVGVQFVGALSTESDIEGKFILEFANSKKDGDPISFIEARKKGYELVNTNQIQSLRFSNNDTLAADIILAKNGVIDAAKAEYAGASLKALTRGFEREKAQLIQKVQKGKIKEQEYLSQLQNLQKEFELQQAHLDALAWNFARVNFDDVNQAYQKALELFKNGKIKEAIAILEKEDIPKQVKDLLDEIKRIERAKAEIKADEKRLQTRKKELIEMLSSLADMHNIDFNPQRAEGIMDTLLLIDNKDLTILQKAADFYKEQHRYNKAFELYPKIIQHPDAKDWQKANAYSYLGELHQTTGDLNKALINFKKFYEEYQHMFSADSSSFNKHNLAISYSKLGQTQAALGNLNKALEFYEYDLKVTLELYKAYPENVSFKNGLAISYEKLGETQAALGNLNKALEFYEIETNLFKELYKAYPENVSFKNGLAISYSKLGQTQADLGNLNKALEFYEIRSKIGKELYKAYPENVSFKNGLAISYSKLGQTQADLGNLNKALEFYEIETNLFKELYKAYPENVSFKNGLAISYSKLGQTQAALGNLNKALEFYENYFNINQELYKAYPENVSFKNGLAISYSKLGQTQADLGNLNKALEFYENYFNINQELYKAYPENVSFKNGLAISYSKLGQTQAALGNLNKALEFYENYFNINQELYKAYPENVSFKNGLAISYSKLGQTQADLGNLNKALEFYEIRSKIGKELYKAYPENVSFKNGLAISYVKLGVIYLENDPKKGMEYLYQAWQLYKELVEVSPNNAGYRERFEILSKALNTAKKATESSTLLEQIGQTNDFAARYNLYQKLLIAQKKEGVSLKELAQTYNSIAWYALLTGNFKKAEYYINEGIKLDAANKYFYTNLPPALLFQGNVKEATKLYKEYSLKAFSEQNLATYKDAFLDDFKAFKDAGIIPKSLEKDVTKIITMLEDM
jgi:tetratricopeptide (TPR) repeat protein